MEQGIYEQLINKLISDKLNSISKDQFYIKEQNLDKAEASIVLSNYLADIIRIALNLIPNENGIEKQIRLSNKIIRLLDQELKGTTFNDDLIESAGKVLTAIFPKLDARFSNFDQFLKEITPVTRLTQSELFTGSNVGISLESEIKKEILSSDKICFLVSFIKWTGIRIFERELTDFTNSGKELKIITTSYMGATDLKAIDFLSTLKNTEVKVSYNSENERLHAKAYLFYRNTGFHTGYIGSSNISRSALTNGLEWNIKITTKEVKHIIDKFQKTFDTYWQDNEFESYNPSLNRDKLQIALKQERFFERTNPAVYFDLTPFPFQQEILDKLEAERSIHNRNKNLIVAATGTGKTVISAFDFKRYLAKHTNAKLLYVAHRKEILTQAQATFRGILKNNNFGELFVDGIEPINYNQVFASVQTLYNRMDALHLTKSYYDFIIIDEVHHIAATSYRPILDKFSPKILLGLTATPERMDGADILSDFCNTIAAEIRLPEALNRKLLTPFQYFGVTDNCDLSQVQWVNGRYSPSALTNLYTSNDHRVGQIIDNCQKYLTNLNTVKALCFCVTQLHAEYMSNKFIKAGLKATFLVSNNADERESIRAKLINNEINYLFVVDIFNEGIDIPEIDTVLFLRPTESLTIFLQQLGRGLRLSEGKECLTVLDFVGNSRPEYDFENKFRALVGKTNTSVKNIIQSDFPHLPLGCSITLEKQAKKYILDNISSATELLTNQLINKIRNFPHQTTLPLSLKHFIDFNHIPIEAIYKRGGWKRLCALAGVIDDFPNKYENEIVRSIWKKWLCCNSITYLRFIQYLASLNFNVNIKSLTKEEQLMCLMLYYDVWQKPKMFGSLQDAIRKIGDNIILVDEIIEVLNILIDKIDFIEKNITLGYSQPLKIHSRYTRDQILSAFEVYSFANKPSNREGVALIKKSNTELLFITLQKSEEDYSPSTLYNDYAISDTLFNWQSQNSAVPSKGKGLSYIQHKKDGKKILLFVREKKQDEFGNTMSYVFLGDADLIEYHSERPMNIQWKLSEPMPAYIWKESAKMAVG